MNALVRLPADPFVEERPFGELERVWNDATYRAVLKQRQAAWHRKVNAGFDAHTRRALAIRDIREAFETMVLEILDAADAAKGVL